MACDYKWEAPTCNFEISPMEQWYCQWPFSAGTPIAVTQGCVSLDVGQNPIWSYMCCYSPLLFYISFLLVIFVDNTLLNIGIVFCLFVCFLYDKWFLWLTNCLNLKWKLNLSAKHSWASNGSAEAGWYMIAFPGTTRMTGASRT